MKGQQPNIRGSFSAIPDDGDEEEGTGRAEVLLSTVSARKPVLSIVHAHPKLQGDDRFEVAGTIVVGRSHSANIAMDDAWISHVHFRICADGDNGVIEDLDSTNGTFVDGIRIAGSRALRNGAIIRAGRCLFAFHEDGRELLEPTVCTPAGMAGPFFAGPLMNEIRRVAASTFHVLIAGPSGVGKELAARVFAALCRREILVHNAARFGTEDEAAASLFGVAKGVFTGVEERAGLIALSDRKVLFIDEAHNLPYRVQKSLLRVMEDSIVSRIGETKESRKDVRFVLASNEPAPVFGLAHDLVARLRTIEISSLKERAADIPAVFRHVAQEAFRRIGRQDLRVDSLFGADHYESLCLDGFVSDNTRGLIRIANRIAEEIAAGAPPEEAVRRVFEKRFAKSPVLSREYRREETAEPSRYPPSAYIPPEPDDPQSLLDEVKLSQETVHLIRRAYKACNGQVVVMAQYLKDRHCIHISRNRLAEILDILKLPRIKRSR